MTMLSSDLFVVEGRSIVFNLTLDAAPSTTSSYTWIVVPKGKFAAFSGDFTTLTGSVTFASGETQKQITIATTENTQSAFDRGFVLEIRNSDGDLIVESAPVIIQENDPDLTTSINSFGGGESDILGAANSREIGEMNGGGGDDYYVITQYQQADVAIRDAFGSNVIKFDFGVEIVGFNEVSVAGGRVVRTLILELSTGSEITVNSPSGRFTYQIGDGAILDYADFKTAIGASGTNETSTLDAHFTVDNSTPVPDLSSNTQTTSSINSFGGGESDILGAANSREIGEMNGGGGDDYYVITQYQQADVAIRDAFGSNVIKFDFGVEIVGFNEVSVAGGRVVRTLILELSTGSEITVNSPSGRFTYQIGDGAILDYADFKTAIGASGTNETSTLDAHFTVPFPSDTATPPPVVDNNATAIALGAGAVSSIAENTDTTSGYKIADLDITDADGGAFGTLTVTGADATLFEIRDGSSGGRELWLVAGTALDFESKSNLNARVELSEDDTVGVDVAISITDVNEAPTATPSTSVSVLEEAAYSFTAADFGFGDVDAGAALASITITALPTGGTLKLNNVNVTQGQTILAADIASLTFTADAVSSTTSVTFTYTVSDGTLDSAPATMSIEVRNDAQATAITFGAGATTTLAENSDTSAGIKVADLVITDADGGSYGALTITGDDAALFEIRDGSSGGKELWIKANVILDYESYLNIDKTASHLNARVELVDDQNIGEDLRIVLTDVPEAPVARQAGEVVLDEGSSVIIHASTFGYDSDLGETLDGIKIKSLPSGGTLLFNGAAVTIDQVLSFTVLFGGVVTFAGPSPFAPGTLVFTADQVDSDTDVTFTYTAMQNGVETSVATYTITVEDVPPPPPPPNIDENLDGSINAVSVLQISVNVPEGETASYALAHARAGFSDENGAEVPGFVIDSATGEITYTGTGLDYEATPFVTLYISDGVTRTGPNNSDPLVIREYIIQVNDVDDPATVTVTPWGSGSDAFSFSLNETDNSKARAIANVSITDQDTVYEDTSWTISDDRFEMLDIGNNRFTFRVKAGQSFDHETEPTITVTVTGAGETYNFAITVDDVYIAPRITSGDSHSFFRENFSTTNETQLYQATAEYEAGTATLTWSLSGIDSSLFEIDSNGWITFVSTTKHDYETNPRYDITLEMRLDGNIVATKDLSFAVIDVNDEDPVFPTQLGTTVLTASDSVHLYRAPVDGSRDPAAATTVFLSSTDLENDGTFRPGAEGNPPITITLLRDSGAIEITGNFIGVDDTGNEDNYFVWAVRRGNDWSFEARSSDASPRNADEQVFLFRLVEGSPDNTSEFNFEITSRLQNGEQANYVAPTTDITVEVAENITANSVVYTMVEPQKDTAAAVITYALVSGGDATSFTIDANTGELRLVGSPDYETQSTYTVTVRATATDGSDITYADQIITVNITNENDVAPTITSSATGTALVEGTAIDTNTVIYTATGNYDVEAITWMIEGGDSQLFTIDPNTGEVKFKAETTPDHETQTSYTFTVLASSGSLEMVRKEVTIEVTDINDQAPVFAETTNILTASDNVHLYKASVAGTFGSTTGTPTGVLHYFQSNVDLTAARHGADGSGTTLTITLLRDTGLVEITGAISGLPALGNGSEYRIWAVRNGAEWTFTSVTGSGAAPTGYEEAVFLYLVSDIDGSSAFTLFGTERLANGETVNLSSSTEFAVDVAENIGANSIIHTFAEPQKDTADAVITYSLVGGDSAAFTIDPSSGELRIVDNPDFENKASYTVTVRATATDGAYETHTDLVVNVNITNVNDELPVITSSDSGTAITEGVAVPTSQVVYTATGTFDVTDIVWTLEGDDAHLFTIDQQTGEVKFNAETTPDHEAKDSYVFTVVATSGSLAPVKKDVTVAVTDVNETGPVFNLSPVIYTASAVGGRFIYSAPVDPDDPSAGTIKFSSSSNFENDGTFRAGSAGSPTVSVTLLLETGGIIVPNQGGNAQGRNIANLPNTGSGESYYIWAVRRGSDWTLEAVANDGAPASYDQKFFLYQLVDDATIGANGFRFEKTTLLADGETAIYYTDDANPRIEEELAADTVIFTVPEAVPDVAGEQVVYSMLEEGDYARFTFDAVTREIKIKDILDHDADQVGTAAVRYTLTIRATTGSTYTDKVVTIALNDINDEAPIFDLSVTTVRGTPSDFYYQTSERFNGGDQYHFQTSVDLNEARHGADGTGTTLSLWLYLPTGTVFFDDVSIPGLPSSVPEKRDNFQEYVYAVRDGQSWSLVGHGDLTPPTKTGGAAYDQTILLYSLLNTKDLAPDFIFDSARWVSDNSDITIYEDASVVEVAEDATPDTVITTLPQAIADVQTSSTVITYEMLASGDHALFTFDPDTRELKVKDTLDFEGSKTTYTVTIRVTVDHPSGTTSTDATLTINVTDVNDEAPVITSDAVATALAEGTLVAASQTLYTAEGTYDLTAITWSLEGGDSSLFVIDPTTGEVKFAADTTPDFETKPSYTFTVVATSGSLDPVKKVVTLAVTDINDVEPEFTFTGGTSFDLPEHTASDTVITTVPVAVADIPDATVTYEMRPVGDYAHFTFDPATRQLKVKDDFDFEGSGKKSFTVTIRATAEHSTGTHFTQQELTINLTNIDDNPPVFTDLASQGLVSENVKASAQNGEYVFTAVEAGEAGNDIIVVVRWSPSGISVQIDPNNPRKLIVEYGLQFSNEVIDAINAVDENGVRIQSLVDASLTSGASPFASPFPETQLSGGTSGLIARIDENSADDVVIFTAKANDVDGDAITYSITAGNDAGLFEIDATTGEVTLVAGQNLDFEDTISHTITVRATSGAQGKTVDQTVNILVNNLPEIPTVSLSNVEYRIDEGFVTQTRIEVATITTEYQGELTLSVSSPGQPYFEIIGNKLYFKAGVTTDYDTLPQNDIFLSVRLIDSAGLIIDAETFTLYISNINDEPPVITSSDTGLALVENTEITTSTTLYQATATKDLGRLEWSLLEDGDHQLFNINRATGIVTLKNSITPNHESKDSYTFTIRATVGHVSGTVHTDKVVTLHVTDVNDVPPDFGAANSVVSGDPGVFIYSVNSISTGKGTHTFMSNVDLSSARHGLVGGDELIITLIRNTGAIRIEDHVTNLPATGNFEIYNVYAVRNGADWLLTAKSAFDGIPAGDESYLLYSILQTGGSSFTLLGAVLVEDGIRYSLAPAEDAVEILETAAAGEVIHTLAEPEVDVASAVLSYEMLTTGDHALFTFDATTREIKVKDALDFEGGTTTYTVTIRATATDASGTTHADRVVNITVTNANDNPAIVTQSGVQVALSEGTFNTETDTGIDLSVADADGGTATMTVADPRFRIDSNGNLLIVAGAEFDFEALTNGELDVEITPVDSGEGDDDANAPTSTPITVTLTFTDVAELPTSAGGTAAVDEENEYTFTAVDFGFSGYKGADTLAAILITSLPQASNGGLLYYDGNPLDPDGGTPPTLPYRITLADIEAGKLTFQPQNTAASYNATFNFKVEDQLGEVSADDAVFTLSVTADNDPGVFSSSNTYTARINAADGGSTTFTDIAASDPEGRVLILQNGAEDIGNPGTFTAQGLYGRLEFVRSTSGTSQWRYFVDAALPATIAIADGVERVDVFTFRIDSTTETVSITVVGQNEDPEFAQDTYREVVYSNIGDTDTILDVGVTDPDGDSLTYSITSGNDNNLFEIDASTGVISLASGVSLATSSVDEHTLTISVSDGRGGTDTTTVTLDVIAPITSGAYLIGATTGDDTRNGTVATEQIQGWDGNDTINTNGGDDIVAGGLGDDIINLGSGAETVLYRFESDFNGAADWKATDGADVINNFQYGTDRLVMIDISGDGDPINNLAEFSADADRPVINVFTGGTNGAFIIGVTFTFDVDGDNAGKVLRINFDTSDENNLLRWSLESNLHWVNDGAVLTDATQLDDYIFDGMIDFITPDGLPAEVTII